MKATGTPAGAPRGRMVLLHGIMSSAATWWRIGPALAACGWALAACGWHVEALDLPAHGDNPRHGQPLTLQALADGTASQVTAPPDLLAGHSLGAITALAMAGRHRPLARALILEDPPATAVASDPALAESITRDAALARADRDALVRREQQANPRWLPGDAERSVDGIAAADVTAITSGLRGPLRWNRLRRLRLQEPDRTWLEDTLPAGRFIVLNGGHCLHRDQPDRWIAEAHAFAAAVVQ